MLFRADIVELNKVCKERCEVILLDCLLQCPSHDNACLRQCIRAETECVNCKLYFRMTDKLRKTIHCMAYSETFFSMPMRIVLPQWMHKLSKSDLL